MAAALLFLLLPVGGICVAQDTTTSRTFGYFGFGAETGMTTGTYCTDAFWSLGAALMNDFSLTDPTSPVRLNMRLMAFGGLEYYGGALAFRYTFYKKTYVTVGYCIKDLHDPFRVGLTNSGNCVEEAYGLLEQSYALVGVGFDFKNTQLEFEMHRQLKASDYGASRLDPLTYSYNRYSGPGKPLVSIMIRLNSKFAY